MRISNIRNISKPVASLYTCLSNLCLSNIVLLQLYLHLCCIFDLVSYVLECVMSRISDFVNTSFHCHILVCRRTKNILVQFRCSLSEFSNSRDFSITFRLLYLFLFIFYFLHNKAKRPELPYHQYQQYEFKFRKVNIYKQTIKIIDRQFKSRVLTNPEIVWGGKYLVP